jgi:hypothetical protein
MLCGGGEDPASVRPEAEILEPEDLRALVREVAEGLAG